MVGVVINGGYFTWCGYFYWFNLIINMPYFVDNKYEQDIKDILKSISTLKFYNLGFGIYNSVYKNYIVCSFPFAIEIHKFPLSINNKNIINNSIFFLHHQDFKNDPHEHLNPCSIYEEISGETSGKSTYHNGQQKTPEEFYIEQKHLFDKVISNNIRKCKIEKLQPF